MPMSKAERKRKIFLEVRSLWGQESKQVRDRSQVSQFVTKHRSRLKDVIREANEASVTDTILNFIKDGILDSELKAKLAFPELFHPSPERSLQHEVLEQEATQSEADALRQAINEHQLDSSIEEENAEASLHQDGEQVSRSDRITLFPLYLNMRCQHLLLNLVQRQLEECCYEFAKQWTPDLLLEKNWPCAEAVELNRWAYVLPRNYHRIPREATSATTAQVLRDTMGATVHIRHAAVHRLRTNANRIERMLEQGLSLAQMLKDESCVLKLEVLKQHLVATIKNIELHKNSLETELDSGLEDIQRRRKELDQEESTIKATVQNQDRENVDRISSTLLDSISHLEAADASTFVQASVSEDDSGNPL